MKIVYLFICFLILPVLLTNIDSTIREGRYANLRNMQASWNHLNLLPGIEGANELRVNKHGLKGDDFSNEKYRILVIGNSLSEGALLDNEEIWSRLLEKNLRSSGRDVKVFNAAKSGSLSAQRFLDVYEAYEEYNFDLVILYPMGAFNPKYRADEGFSEYYVPDYKNPELGPKNNSIVQILRNRKWEFASYLKRRFGVSIFKNTIVDPNHVKAVIEKAKLRRSLEQYPMSEQYLEDYEANFKKGVDLVTAFFKAKTKPILFIDRLHVTSMNPSDEDLKYWWGDLIDGKRVSKDDYPKILNIEHRLLLGAAGKDRYFLSQEEIAPDPSWFYDHHHFNEPGSLSFSKALSKKLLQILP